MRFRKKPVEIEAHFFDGTPGSATRIIDWVLEGDGTARFHSDGEVDGPFLAIDTLEGTMKAPAGWWIIRGVQGEHYPCEESIFRQSYDEVEGQQPTRAFAPMVPTRERPFTCPNCLGQVTARPSGHINPHWTNEGYDRPHFTCTKAKEAS